MKNSLFSSIFFVVSMSGMSPAPLFELCLDKLITCVAEKSLKKKEVLLGLKKLPEKQIEELLLKKYPHKLDYVFPKRLRGHNYSVGVVTFTPDNKLISGSVDTTIRIWDRVARRKKILQGHKSEIMVITVNSVDNTIVSTSIDGITKTWDLATYKNLKTIKEDAPVRIVRDVGSPDSKHIASIFTEDDRIIQIREAQHVGETGSKCQKILTNKKSVLSLAYSPDGKYFAAGSWDKTIKVWKRGPALTLNEILSILVKARTPKTTQKPLRFIEL